MRLSAVQIWFARLDTNPALIDEFEATLSPRVLSRATGLSPASLAFTLNDFGKPYLQNSLQFNLSHSEDLVALGLVDQREIGVDVEFVRPMPNLEDIAASVYTPGELASLLQAPGADRERLFFRYRTRKESYIKAIGKGLSIPLNTFDTRFPRIENWWIQDLASVPAGYSGAVTVANGIEHIGCCEWRPR